MSTHIHNSQTKIWIAFANAAKCNHAAAFNQLRFICWTMNGVKFNIGDIVYLFTSDTRSIRFKGEVVEENVPRSDCQFWKISPPNDMTYKVKRLGIYNGILLDERHLLQNGFHGGRSLQHPIYKNKQLIDYVTSIF